MVVALNREALRSSGRRLRSPFRIFKTRSCTCLKKSHGYLKSEDLQCYVYYIVYEYWISIQVLSKLNQKWLETLQVSIQGIPFHINMEQKNIKNNNLTKGHI